VDASGDLFLIVTFRQENIFQSHYQQCGVNGRLEGDLEATLHQLVRCLIDPDRLCPCVYDSYAHEQRILAPRTRAPVAERWGRLLAELAPWEWPRYHERTGKQEATR
jgi:hypothetical protein